MRSRSTRWEAALFALGCALRCAWLTAQSAGGDEGKTLVFLHSPFSSVLELARGIETSPPLYFGLVRLWAAPWPDALLGARVLSALLGIAALAAFHRLCRRVLPQQAAFWAFAAACVCPSWVHASQYARNYSLLLLLSVVQCRLALPADGRWTPRRWALYGLACAAALHTHYYAAFLSAALAALLAWRLRGRPRALAAGALTHAVAAASLWPWISAAAQSQFRHRMDFGRETLDLRMLGINAASLWADTGYLRLAFPGAMSAAGLLLLALIAAGAALLPRPSRSRALGRLGLLASGLALAKAANAAVDLPVAQPLYFLPLTVPLLLALGDILAQGPRVGALAARGLLAASAAAALGAYYYLNVALDPELARLSERLRRGSDTRDVLVFADSFYYASMRYHYLPERPAYCLRLRSTWNFNWSPYPGYPAAIGPIELRRRRDCVVLDRPRALSDAGLWRAPCREVAAAAAAKG